MSGLKFDPKRVKPKATVAPASDFSLLGNDTQEAVAVPVELIDPYVDPEGNPQPFKLYGEEAMDKLVESVREQGILTPLRLRPKAGGRYEILAGHNRHAAAVRVGLATVPAVIRSCDDDEAALIVVETNLRQRQSLLPSERAKAYRLKMNAISRRGQRNDLSGDEHHNSAEEIAKETQGSGRNVFRYLRLTELEPELVELVDASRITVEAGGELSRLPHDQQKELADLMRIEQVKKLSPAKAKELIEYSEAERLTQTEMRRILDCADTEKPVCLTVKVKVNGLMSEAQRKQLMNKAKERCADPAFAQALIDFLENTP